MTCWEGSAADGFADADERRCARLHRERLETDLAVSAAGEPLRTISIIFGPPQGVRGTFLLMPTAGAEDWAVIGRRLGRSAERASTLAQVGANLTAEPAGLPVVDESLRGDIDEPYEL